jgi:NADH/NAD ratio-sensing transcriptional regulator Rex
VRLHLPAHVCLENVDLASSLEKVSFFARVEARESHT